MMSIGRNWTWTRTVRLVLPTRARLLITQVVVMLDTSNYHYLSLNQDQSTFTRKLQLVLELNSTTLLIVPTTMTLDHCWYLLCTLVQFSCIYKINQHRFACFSLLNVVLFIKFSSHSDCRFLFHGDGVFNQLVRFLVYCIRH